MLISPEEMSVELIQQLYGTPQRSTDGDEQLKYSFFDLRIKKIYLDEIFEKNCKKIFKKF